MFQFFAADVQASTTATFARHTFCVWYSPSIVQQNTAIGNARLAWFDRLNPWQRHDHIVLSHFRRLPDEAPKLHT
jgi:hypothetical protein